MPSDLTLKAPILPDPMLSKEDILASLRGENPLQGEIDLGKGLAISPLTLGPDLVHLAAPVYNWAVSQVEQRAFDGRDVGWRIPDNFSGDITREFVGLDPDSKWGMVGEMMGGWENIAAKGATLGGKLFAAAMEEAPGIVHAAIIGARGARALDAAGNPHFVKTMLEAEKLEKAGVNAAEITARTGWYRGTDDKWKVYLSDAGSKVNEPAIRQGFLSQDIGIGEYGKFRTKFSNVFMPGGDLFKAYPDMMDAPIEISFKRVKDVDGQPSFVIVDEKHTSLGAFDDTTGTGYLFNTHSKQDARESAASTMLHEMGTHWIQKFEDFHRGADYTPFKETASAYIEHRNKRLMLEDMKASDPVLMGPDDFMEYLQDFSNRHNLDINIDGPEADIFYDLMADARVASRAEMDSLARTEMIREANWLNIAGWELKLGNQDPDSFMKALKEMDDDEVFRLAKKRYFAEPGEVDARITQFFKDRQQEEMDRLIKAKGDPATWATSALDEGPLKPEEVVIKKEAK